MVIDDKRYTIQHAVTMFEARVNQTSFFEKESCLSSVSVFEPSGKLVTFEERYIAFMTFERAIDVLRREAMRGNISW